MKLRRKHFLIISAMVLSGIGIYTALKPAEEFKFEPTTVGKERIELQCGSHRVAITCGKARPGDPKNEQVCVHNTLSFTDANGKVFYPKQPKNFRDEFEMEKTPKGLSCGKGADQKYYVDVVFIAGPIDCGLCMTIDLFSASGQRLTVNSKNLDRTIEKFKIKFGKSIYIEEDR